MKAKERHHLKQNAFAETVMRLAAAATANSQRLITIGVVVVLLGAAIGGYAWWRKGISDAAGALLGDAQAITQAQIIPASTLPTGNQAFDTFPTETARSEAALEAFREVLAAYPGTAAATAARYHEASLLMALGQHAEAETAFRAAVTEGASTVYGPTSHLGLCEALVRQEKYDEAIAELTTLAADRESTLPIDGVLMELGKANLKADRPADARGAFQRVIDEFPTSPYVGQARQQIAEIG